jgi:hypothetical protein
MTRCKQLFIFLLLCTFISGCEKKPHVPPLSLLAKEAKFLIGGRQLQVPLVAITTFGRADVAIPCKEESTLRPCSVPLLELSKHEIVPISVIAITIALENYKTYQDAYTDSYVDLSKICHMLSREWSRQICDEKIIPYTDNGLAIDRLILLENDAFYALEGHSIGGSKDSLPSILSRIKVVGNEPNFYCVPRTGICIVKMKLEASLVAVWFSESVYKEGLDIEAESVRSLVKYSLGEKENFPAFKASLRYKRPLH